MPSGKADKQRDLGSLPLSFYLQKLWSVDTVSIVTLSLIINETLKSLFIAAILNAGAILEVTV